MKAIDRRLAALEAQYGGADVVGIWKEPHEWQQDADDRLRVCGTGERLSLAEFEQRYPSGTLIRLMYVESWPHNQGSESR